MTPPTASSRPAVPIDIDTDPAYFPAHRRVQVTDPHRPRIPRPVPGVGLGDVFARLTRLSGIHALWNWQSKRRGKPCGCAARRKRWNRIRFRWPISLRG